MTERRFASNSEEDRFDQGPAAPAADSDGESARTTIRSDRMAMFDWLLGFAQLGVHATFAKR